jgi:hypothetical protein
MADERDQEDLEIKDEEAEKVQGGLAADMQLQANPQALLKDKQIVAEP